jgi:hypothetical protein
MKTVVNKVSRGFILPVVLILIFLSLSVAIVSTRMILNATESSGSALGSFISNNYARSVSSLCEDIVIAHLDGVDTTKIFTGTPPTSSSIWQGWAKGSTSDPGGPAKTYFSYPRTNADLPQSLRDTLPATADAACVIEPLVGGLYVVTIRAKAFAASDLVQLQSYISGT